MHVHKGTPTVTLYGMKIHVTTLPGFHNATLFNMIGEKLRKKPSRSGPYLRHGSRAWNVLSYVDLKAVFHDDIDLEKGNTSDKTSQKKEILTRLRSEDLEELKKGTNEEKALYVKRLPTSIKTKRVVRYPDIFVIITSLIIHIVLWLCPGCLKCHIVGPTFS